MKRCSASPGAGQMVRQILAYPGGNRLLILGQKIASLSRIGNVSLHTSICTSKRLSASLS